MKEFVAAYKKRVGEWNDEAGTKVYALELILAVLQKNRGRAERRRGVQEGDGRRSR